MSRPSHLLIVVQVLGALDRAIAWYGESIDLINPLGAASSDVATDDYPKGTAVNLSKRLAIHLPGEDYFFILANFAVGHRYSVVVYFELPMNGCS